MERSIVKGVRQVGLCAPDPDRLAEFYQAVLGLEVVAQSKPNLDGIRGSVFLSSQPHEASDEAQDQVAIFANPAMRHAAFEVEALADLRALYQVIIERDLPIRWALNHGVSLAFYFDDPAGNLIKIYWPTGIVYPQPHGHPIDLTQSEAALRQDVADLVAQLKRSTGGNNGLEEDDE
jgi:catechol-2,3-dioxygenase